MNESGFYSLLLSLLLGGVVYAIGYLSPLIKKFDDRREDICLHFLPSLNYGIASFMEAKEVFLIDSNLHPYLEKMRNISIELEKQIFSGEMLFIKQDLRERLLDFSRGLRKFQAILEQVGENDNTKEILTYSFKSGQSFLKEDINPNLLLEDAKNIQNMIESQIKDFKSYSNSLILTVLVGIILTAIKIFKT